MALRPFSWTSVSNLSEAPAGRFTPRSHWLRASPGPRSTAIWRCPMSLQKDPRNRLSATRWSGKEVPLLATPSPQNRTCDFHHIRLKQTSHRIGLPRMARPLMAGVLALFAALLAASNIRQNRPSLPPPMTGPPVARQHPFGLGIAPIQRLMVSSCLSAAGLRFLQPPVPAEELALPRGRVTDSKVRPQRGFPVPHP